MLEAALMRTSFRHQSEAQPPNGPLTAATSPDTPSTCPATQSGLRGPAARQRIPARCTHWVGPRHPRDLVGERDGGDLRSPDVLARLGALAPVRAGGGSDERRSSRTSLRVPPSACL